MKISISYFFLVSILTCSFNSQRIIAMSDYNVDTIFKGIKDGLFELPAQAEATVARSTPPSTLSISRRITLGDGSLLVYGMTNTYRLPTVPEKSSWWIESTAKVIDQTRMTTFLADEKEVNGGKVLLTFSSHYHLLAVIYELLRLSSFDYFRTDVKCESSRSDSAWNAESWRNRVMGEDADSRMARFDAHVRWRAQVRHAERERQKAYGQVLKTSKAYELSKREKSERDCAGREYREERDFSCALGHEQRTIENLEKIKAQKPSKH